MLVRTFALLVLLGVGGAAAWAFSPGLRTQMTAFWDSHTGWTEAARQADPAGFASHAEAKLKQDLAKMDATRRELTAEVGRLSKTAREQSALAEQARRLAEQFRDVYQTAQADNHFPIEVRGAAYTESQVHSQVSMLLAEAEGYEASLADLEAVRTTAEAKIEELAVRINRTEAQLASLATKRELLRARQLTAAGEELLAQVDELMTGNRQTIDANPVATVRELLARTRSARDVFAFDGFHPAAFFQEVVVLGTRRPTRRGLRCSRRSRARADRSSRRSSPFPRATAGRRDALLPAWSSDGWSAAPA
jgi:phage shock protein A